MVCRICSDPKESAVHIDAVTLRIVTDTLKRRKMGGLVISLKHQNVATLISFAREYGITHIVLGRPGRRKLLRWFEPTLYEHF